MFKFTPTTYKLSPKFEAIVKENNNFKFIVQHVESGSFDLSDSYTSVYEAAEFEDEFGKTCYRDQTQEEAFDECLETIFEYTAAEVIEAANANKGWPIELGFVVEVEDEVEEEDFDDMEDEEETIVIAPEYAMNEKFIIHHGVSETDYSSFSSPEAAWEEVSGESWVERELKRAGISRSTLRAAWLEQCETYTADEVIELAKAGYDWPSQLGFVVEA